MNITQIFNQYSPNMDIRLVTIVYRLPDDRDNNDWQLNIASVCVKTIIEAFVSLTQSGSPQPPARLQIYKRSVHNSK